MSDAASGPAAATTAPSARRASRSSPKLDTVALQSIAAAQRKSTRPSVVVRRTRSARTPNGSVATAPTSAVTVTRSPMSVFVMFRLVRSACADAPTVAASAPASPSTHASRTITRARSSPPSSRVSPRLIAPAAAAPRASPSPAIRCVRFSPLIAGIVVSDVAASQQDGRDRDRESAVTGKEEAARERSQRVIGVPEGEHLLSRFAREVLLDRVLPARRQRQRERWNDEEDRDVQRDPARGVANDRAERDCEDADEGDVDGGHKYAPGNSRRTERDLKLRDVAEDCLCLEEADQERGHH